MSMHYATDISWTGTSAPPQDTPVLFGALAHGLELRHDSTGGVPLRVRLGSTNATTGDMELKPGETFSVPNLHTVIDRLSITSSSSSTTPATLLRVRAWG